ncbi:MAG: hypothetical protein H7318_07975 [Oligoflexus sp.]|nr:hypothetical protein [Oligoflexus sp.]
MSFLKMIAASSLIFSSMAMAETVAVKFSVVESNLSKIDWQNGWSLIDVYALASNGSIVRPSAEGVFEFPASGTYTFQGQGAAVCGMSPQKVKITSNIVEIRLFGWCE